MEAKDHRGNEKVTFSMAAHPGLVGSHFSGPHMLVLETIPLSSSHFLTFDIFFPKVYIFYTGWGSCLCQVNDPRSISYLKCCPCSLDSTENDCSTKYWSYLMSKPIYGFSTGLNIRACKYVTVKCNQITYITVPAKFCCS